MQTFCYNACIKNDIKIHPFLSTLLIVVPFLFMETMKRMCPIQTHRRTHKVTGQALQLFSLHKKIGLFHNSRTIYFLESGFPRVSGKGRDYGQEGGIGRGVAWGIPGWGLKISRLDTAVHRQPTTCNVLKWVKQNATNNQTLFFSSVFNVLSDCALLLLILLPSKTLLLIGSRSSTTD